MTDSELNALRGMVNLDVVGLPQELELIGSPDFVAQAGLIADNLGLPWRPSEVPGGLGSDHVAFIAAGVPSVFLYRHDELFHTPQDTADRMSPASLAETVEVAAAFLAELGPPS
jgi:Zn-dependent M28 family amino/carboxypeptidase